MKSKLGLESTLIEGDRGEFTVWVDGTRVISKQGDEFPTEDAVVAAVGGALKKAP